jgi:cytochrome b561
MPTRYARPLVILHWLVAILILVLLGAGKILLSETPNSDPAKLTALMGHMIFAGVVLILMLVRLVVRLRSEAPPPANAAAPLAHLGLYVLVFLMLGSGIAMSMGYGLPQTVFAGQGSLPEQFDGLARTVHGWSSSLLLLLVIVHIAAAVYHAAVKRDGVMARMSLRR